MIPIQSKFGFFWIDNGEIMNNWKILEPENEILMYVLEKLSRQGCERVDEDRNFWDRETITIVIRE